MGHEEGELGIGGVIDEEGFGVEDAGGAYDGDGSGGEGVIQGV